MVIFRGACENCVEGQGNEDKINQDEEEEKTRQTLLG